MPLSSLSSGIFWDAGVSPIYIKLGKPHTVMKRYISTLTASLLFLACPLVFENLFFNSVALPFLVIWLVYSVFIIWRHPPRRREQSVKIAIWVVAVVLIFQLGAYLEASARSNAEQVLTKVLQYRSQHGLYPSDLRKVGLDDAEEKRRRMLFYGVNERKEPFLVYASIYNPLDKYGYNFTSGQWQLELD